MTATALLVLIAGAMIGVWLVYVAVRQHKSSPRLGLLHAALVLSGTALLLTTILTGPASKLSNFSALFLLLAVIGGGLVFALREPGKPPSMPVVTAHAIFGLIGIAILAIKVL